MSKLISNRDGTHGTRGTSFASPVADTYRIVNATGTEIAHAYQARDTRFTRGVLCWKVIQVDGPTLTFSYLAQARAWASAN